MSNVSITKRINLKKELLDRVVLHRWRYSSTFRFPQVYFLEKLLFLLLSSNNYKNQNFFFKFLLVLGINIIEILLG